MIYCNNCGEQLADGTQSCPSCGAPVATNRNQQAYSQQTGYDGYGQGDASGQQRYYQNAEPSGYNQDGAPNQQDYYQENQPSGYNQGGAPNQQDYYQENQSRGYGQGGAPNQQGHYGQPQGYGAASYGAMDEAQSGKVMAILAYIIFFIPLITGDHKTNRFVRYHANQGIALFFTALAWGIVYWILTAILTAILFNPTTWVTGAGLGAWGIITTILGLVWILPTILCIIGIIHAAKGEKKRLPVIGKFRILK